MPSPEYETLAAADPHYLDSAGRHWGYSTMLKINIVTCSLSFVGSLVMIVPFILFHQLRKIRHRLILGMAVNDLLQSITVLIPSSWSFHHGALRRNSPGCNADSFFYLTFVVAGCFWTAAIAITTYVTLVQPMSKAANYMHRSRSIYLIWTSIWLICTVNAAIGTALNTSVDGGGFCFFPSVSPYLYGNLVLFIPRAGTFVLIIFIYARLYIFFRNQASSHHKQESGIQESSFHVPLPTPASEVYHVHFPEGTPDDSSSDRRESEGSSDHQLSGLTTTTSVVRDEQTAAVLQSKLVHYKFIRRMSRRDSQESSATVVSGPRQSWLGKGTIRRHQSVSEETDALPTSSVQEATEGGSESAEVSSAILQDSAEILSSPQGFEEQLVMLGQQHHQPFRIEMPGSKTPTPLQTPAGEEASLLSGSTRVVTPATEKDETSISSRSNSIPKGSPLRGIVPMGDAMSPGADSLLTLASPMAAPIRTEFPGLTVQEGNEEAQDANSPVMGLWEALASVDPVDSDDNALAEARSEKGRRLSASEENRRVSYLMLLYPLAYGVILAVSIARLIVTMATGASPSPWLQFLNRICVLGTGVVDAIIYTVIEWRFRASSQAAARSKARRETMEMKSSLQEYTR
ncbi:hypothetical protein P389DRAFT_191156 [Cystobasidium minutum MCA 4210]|uniref:uncharacterized protein n=1 Tax=Cystobasidium minutum MCA 4210 TaxID=1397322 RepID=UPI0034CFA09D|eukprot:jgi/Rhomi1/191156/estExt_fgenesh1_pg.C_70143